MSWPAWEASPAQISFPFRKDTETKRICVCFIYFYMYHLLDVLSSSLVIYLFLSNLVIFAYILNYSYEETQ